MGLQTQLLEGKKIRFANLDIDTWSYNQSESRLEQWIDGQSTGAILPVVELDQESITVDWGSAESNISLVDLELI